jgi:DNA-binding NtrC family response regulator
MHPVQKVEPTPDSVGCTLSFFCSVSIIPGPYLSQTVDQKNFIFFRKPMNEMIAALIIDDEPAILHLIKVFLEETGDIRCTCVESTHDALERLSREEYDVVICDYQLGPTDGITLFNSARLFAPDLPFIIFSGRGDEVMEEVAGCDGIHYLKKGMDLDDQFCGLIRLIREVSR